MGKPTICIGENKDADQLRGNREADQRLCFRYSDSTIPIIRVNRTYNRINRGLIRLALGPFECIRVSRV